MNQKAKQTAIALRVSIATAAFLALIKLMTGLLTNSMAVLSSALDSAMDVASSSVNFIAAREAAKPPDEDHAYGHGKIESLAALFQSTFIGLSGLYVVFESIRRLIFGAELHRVAAGIGVMFFSIVITWLLVLLLSRFAKKTQSLILKTERLHFTTDIMSNGSVVVALGLVQWTGIIFWDLLASTLAALWIFRVSYKIFRQAADELLDRSLLPVSVGEIENIIRNFDPSIIGIHNFRSRKVGDQIFMDFHIEIRGETDFRQAHDKTEAVISKIQETYQGSDITVHFDPEGAK